MIDLAEHQRECTCKKMANKRDECLNDFTVSEKGKSIKLECKRPSECVTAIIIDGCIIKDNKPKCDALFLYKRKSGKYSFLVELKGAGDIKKAFTQLSYTKDKRSEYKDIIQNFRALDGTRVIQKCVIVSNGMLSKPEQETLEKENNIRVAKILRCDATTPIPDLKELI